MGLWGFSDAVPQRSGPAPRLSWQRVSPSRLHLNSWQNCRMLGPNSSQQPKALASPACTPAHAMAGPGRKTLQPYGAWPRYSGATRRRTPPASLPRVLCPWLRQPPRVKAMERNTAGELEGQTSVNDLLDEPIGDSPIQLALPILIQIRPGEFRRLS